MDWNRINQMHDVNSCKIVRSGKDKVVCNECEERGVLLEVIRL